MDSDSGILAQVAAHLLEGIACIDVRSQGALVYQGCSVFAHGAESAKPAETMLGEGVGQSSKPF